MRRDDAAIEKSVRRQFPFYFGEDESISVEAYAKRRDAVSDYAASVSGAAFTPETVRYQSILLISTLVFVSFGFLHVASFKVLDGGVTLDPTAFGFYTFFLIAIGVIFSLKASVDYARVRISREKNSEAILELQKLITIGRGRELIEQFYREEVEEAIGNAYTLYSKLLDEKCDLKSSPSPWPRATVIDETILRTNPEFAKDIDHHRHFVRELKADLNSDVARLEAEAGQIEPPDANDRFASKTDAYPRMTEIYQDTLQPWLQARNRWVDVGVAATFKRLVDDQFNGLSKAHLKTLKRIIFIRRAYFWLELMAPLFFAVAAIVVTDIHVHRVGLPGSPKAVVQSATPAARRANPD